MADWNGMATITNWDGATELTNINGVEGILGSGGGIDANAMLVFSMEQDPIVDISDNAYGVTMTNFARSSAQAKFGTYSGFGSAANCQIITNDNFSITTGDGTWEGWFFLSSGDGCMFAGYGGAGTEWYQLDMDATGNFTITFRNGTGDANINYQGHTTNAPYNYGSWCHVAFVVSGGNWVKVFIDGVESTLTVDFAQKADLNITSIPWVIGNNRAQGDRWDGYIDSVRISNVARYSSGFTPPAQEWS